tara:strand:- start:1223 stop:1720 length:498 start_codon:yes stop_codon:yes gene_type:complete
MKKLFIWIKNSLRLIPWVFSASYFTYRRLPEKSQNELYDIAKNPNKWKKSIETAWDISKITAEHFKDTSETLANIAIGRKISIVRRKEAQNDLAALSTLIPPLRVFMIPGSHILLGILARVTPWRLIPDDWIPINALKKIREDEVDIELEKESKMITKLLRRKRK